MNKHSKRFFIVLSMWGIGRLVPAFFSVIFPYSALLSSVMNLLFLYLGWRTSVNISEGNHPTCIRVNLGIFIYLEVTGFLNAFLQVLEVASDFGLFSSIFTVSPLVMLMGSIGYFVLCAYLWHCIPDNTSDDD